MLAALPCWTASEIQQMLIDELINAVQVGFLLSNHLSGELNQRKGKLFLYDVNPD